MKIGFLGFDQYHGKTQTGSSRIRVDNLIKYWGDEDEVERFHQGKQYDVTVLQKAYWPEYAAAAPGIKILDMCDADWIAGGYKIMETLEHCHAVTCSSMAIASFMAGVTDKPVAYIPDRIDFEVIEGKFKEHVGEAKTIAWFGYHQNHEMLSSAMRALAKRNLELIVVSDKTFVWNRDLEDVEVTNYPWNQHTWIDDILRADIVINPQYDTGHWKFKSNNKTTQAWAIGMPVAHTDKELDLFISEEARTKEAEEKYKLVKDEYDVRQSVEEMKDLIKELST